MKSVSEYERKGDVGPDKIMLKARGRGPYSGEKSEQHSEGYAKGSPGSGPGNPAGEVR